MNSGLIAGLAAVSGSIVGALGSAVGTWITTRHQDLRDLLAKKIVRREWTKDDVRQLKTMAKAKAGVTRISKSLKRTAGATSVMAAKLGVSLSTRT